MTKYVRLCKTTNTKGEIIPWTTSSDKEKRVKVAPNSDWYTSLFHYEKEADDYFNTNKSINGFSGKATLDELVFDLDCKNNVESARADGIALLKLLRREGLDLNKNVRIYFSGGKGFHIHVSVGKSLTNDEIKTICTNLAKGLTSFDAVVYNTTRLFRVPNTKHNKSGLFKIQLTAAEIQQKTVEEIKKLATKPRSLSLASVAAASLDFMAKYEETLKPKQTKSVVVDGDEGVRGLGEIKFKDCPNAMPRCVYALTHGIMESGVGERSQIFLRLAAYYKNQGMTKEAAYGALKGVARDNSRLYPEHDQFEPEEIWNTVIQSVYGKFSTWKTKPGTTGINADNEIFKKYCDSVDHLTDVPCSLHHRKVAPNTTTTISGIENSFDNFATNFENNTVKTGIKLIDDNMKIAVGTTTLLCGATGCHRKGEKVMKFDGTFTKVEDVLVGDSLMGADSSPREVLNLFNGTDTMYKIKPVKGEEFFVNGAHILVYENSHAVRKECTVEEYLKKYTTGGVGNTMLRASVDFKEQELLIDPYIMGVWLGYGAYNSARIFTQMSDSPIIEALREYGSKIGVSLTTAVSGDKCPSHALTGNNAAFVTLLKACGVYKNKHVPLEYLVNSRKNRLELLAGLMDTDGSLSTGCFDFIQKRKTISESVVKPS